MTQKQPVDDEVGSENNETLLARPQGKNDGFLVVGLAVRRDSG